MKLNEDRQRSRGIAAIIALSVWLIVMGAWGMSYVGQADDWELPTDEGYYFYSRRGQLEIRHNQAGVAYPPAAVPLVPWVAWGGLTDEGDSLIGMTKGYIWDGGIKTDLSIFYVRHWILAVVSGLPAVYFLMIWFRLKRLQTINAQGFCIKCGYDLRATPDRCPECGAVPGKTA